MMSGERLKGFREGWALKAFNFGKAHYFRRKEAGLVVAICGSQDAPAGYLFGPGDWKRCQRCEKLREAEIAKGAPSASEAGEDARGGVGE